MAWDFSTEPEFEEKLEWMRTFVREEIYPLETIDLDEGTFRRLTDPLKEEVKKQGLWAAHLDPELGGQGFGQVKLGLMHEILGASIFAPPIYGNHSEIYYRDVRVPYENLIGNEGDGFVLAQKRLGPGRIHHCMRWLGQSKRAFDMLCERALSRYASGSTLAEKQTVQNWIADSAAEMQAARLMTLHAAWKMDQQGSSAARVEIAMIKYFGAPLLVH